MKKKESKFFIRLKDISVNEEERRSSDASISNNNVYIITIDNRVNN